MPEHLDADALYRAHAQFVARFLLRLGVSGEDVADVVQEVFLVAHRRGGFTMGRAKPTTWLAEIAFRVSSDRRKKARRRLEDSNAEVVELAPSASSSASPSQRAEARQALARVQRALDTLSPEKRAVFVLYELEGQACDAIASSLDVPVGTIYSRLHSARREFAKAHAALENPTRPARGEPALIAGLS
ncbi:MAG: RNA polymerase sigma factor [Nannocystaceae bacterium]|nr:RNA polymerase sigma factor [bacterium]